jgi:hypothetical protein
MRKNLLFPSSEEILYPEEAESSIETLVSIYQTTQRHIPQECIIFIVSHLLGYDTVKSGTWLLAFRKDIPATR